MSTYRVYFQATASHVVEVEADDRDAAIDAAYDAQDFPFFSGGMAGDLGEWEVPDGDEYVEEVTR